MLSISPNLSMDELNAALQQKMIERNNQPQPDFCGVTPTQMANWFYAPFDELQWVTISTPDEFCSSPVMRYIDRFLQFWGFVIIDPRRYKGAEPVARLVQLQPLLKQTFQFSIQA